MHIIDASTLINFDQSNFKDLLNKENPNNQVSSFEDFLEINKSRKKYLKPTSINIKEKKHLFRIPFDILIIISQKLKDDIENSDLTGLKIKPYNFTDININKS